MGFNSAPKPITESNEKPKNRLNRLHSETPESLDNMKLHDINLIRDFFQQEWYDANKGRIDITNVTEAQLRERDRYVDGIEISRIRDAINQIINDKDTSPKEAKRFELLRAKLSLP